MILGIGSAGLMLSLANVATVMGIITDICFTVSIVAAFIPKFRKKAANHFVALVREANNE